MRLKKKPLMILIVSVALLLGLLAWIIWSNTALELNTYTIECDQLPAAFNGYRIAHISDLHNAEIGNDNEKLLSVLSKAKPDMIAVTGDLIDSRRTDMEVALRFMEKAMLIAPCYYVSGNHEARIDTYDALKAGLDQLGVIVLTNEMIGVTRNGEMIALLGLEDPDFQTTDASLQVATKLEELPVSQTEFTVLLSHRPELFNVYADYNLDLVLTGHTHGGQFRLPFVGAVIAPDQGLFPKYDAGLYTKGETNMIISRGIGNSVLPFRFNNCPEIIVVELHKK